MPRLVISLCIFLCACGPTGVKLPPETNKAVSSGQIESTVTSALQKAGELKHLNLFIHLDSSGALQQAKQLDSQAEPTELNGMLLAVKDNIHVAGLPNSAGTLSLKNFVPKNDNPVIQRLRDAGAIVLGKANMHELAFGITSDNATFGAVANPHNTAKFAGGSSGGTAAAIAAGVVDAGLGTDTGGSTRIPAALTGVVGFRPSNDRYATGAVTPVSSTRDTIGPIARSVEILIRLDSAITNDKSPIEAAEITSLRLGVDRAYFFSHLDPEVSSNMDRVLKNLEQAGITLVPAEVPQLAELLLQSGFPIAVYEAVHELPPYLEKYNTGVSFDELVAQIASPDVQAVFAAATTPQSAVPDEVYQKALQARQQLIEIYQNYFAQYKLDAMIFPTTKLPARDIKGSTNTVELNGAQVPTFPSYIHNTDPASIAGLPGISLPAGMTADGLPLGIELNGPAGMDRRILAIALAIEEIVRKQVL